MFLQCPNPVLNLHPFAQFRRNFIVQFIVIFTVNKINYEINKEGCS